MGDVEIERIAAAYRTFAHEAAEESPLYARLSSAVAGNGDVLRFLAVLPTGKRQPNLLFAAVRYLHGTPSDAAELCDLVARDSGQLAATMRERATQTNEPGRCAALLPLLSAMDEPLALIEVGASAGLCLYPDRFSYTYDGWPVGARSGVHLRCTTRGELPLPGRLPEVVARTGIDLNPLDPAAPDDRAWLRALVWPGPRAAERLARLDAATEIAAREPAVLLRGDLAERLPEAVGLVPEGSTAVVFHTAVLPYLRRAAQARFAELVQSLPVRWIAQEPPGCRPGNGRAAARRLGAGVRAVARRAAGGPHGAARRADRVAGRPVRRCRQELCAPRGGSASIPRALSAASIASLTVRTTSTRAQRLSSAATTCQGDAKVCVRSSISSTAAS